MQLNVPMQIFGVPFPEHEKVKKAHADCTESLAICRDEFAKKHTACMAVADEYKAHLDRDLEHSAQTQFNIVAVTIFLVAALVSVGVLSYQLKKKTEELAKERSERESEATAARMRQLEGQIAELKKGREPSSSS